MDNIILYGILVVNLLLLWVAVFWGLSIMNRKNNLEEYRIDLESAVDNTAPMLLNEIIADSYQEYMALNENFKDGYINQEREETMLKGIKDFVAKRLSKPVLVKLTSYYNEEALYEIIASKIYIIVVGTAIEHNGIKDDREEL